MAAPVVQGIDLFAALGLPLRGRWLRQRSEAIHTFLAHPLLDPISSGRVVMDYVMKLVTTALEWSYAVRETDVVAERLQAADELLTLRRDAIRVIDGIETIAPSARRSDGNVQEVTNG